MNNRPLKVSNQTSRGRFIIGVIGVPTKHLICGIRKPIREIHK